MFGEANYASGTTFMWLNKAIKSIADSIVEGKKAQLAEAKKGVPQHV